MTTTIAQDPAKLTEELRQFTGSQRFTRWTFNSRHVLSEGAHYLAETAGAFWLMDILASVQHLPAVRSERFQSWFILVFDGSRPLQAGVLPPTEDVGSSWAYVWATDGNGLEIYRQLVHFTDFPLGLYQGDVKKDALKLYAVRNELGGITIMVPSEY